MDKKVADGVNGEGWFDQDPAQRRPLLTMSRMEAESRGLLGEWQETRQAFRDAAMGFNLGEAQRRNADGGEARDQMEDEELTTAMDEQENANTAFDDFLRGLGQEGGVAPTRR